MPTFKNKIAPDEILLFLLLLFGPLAYGLVETWSLTTAQLVIVSLVTIAALIRICKGELRFYRTPADIPIFFFIISLLISYSISVYPYASRIVICKGLIAILLFYYIVNTQRSREKINRLLWVIVILGALYAVMGLTLIKGDILGFKIFSRARYHISLFYVNYNHFAGYLELVFCLALGLATANRGGKRVFLFGMTVLIAAALLFTLSRGGILGAAGGLAFFVITLAFMHREKKGRLIFFSAIFFGLIIIAWFGLDPVLDRLSTLEDISVAGEARIQLWQDTLPMIYDRPLFGWGPGTFSVAFPAYQTEGFRQLFVNYAHNDYLELAADTGLLGLVIFLGGLLLLYISCLRKLAGRTGKGAAYRQHVGIGALAACFALLIHSVTDCNLQIPANLFLFVIAAGIAAVAAEDSGRRKADRTDTAPHYTAPHSPSGKAVALTACCLWAGVSAAILLLPFFGERAFNAAKTSFLERKYDDALTKLDRALLFAPDNADYLSFKGDILLTKRIQQDTLADIENCTECKKIIFWYRKACDAAPTNSSFIIKKAFTFERYKKITAAEKAYKEAIQLSPMYAQTYYYLAVLLLRQRQLDSALTYFRRFLETEGTQELPKVLDDLWSAGGDYDIQKQAVPDTATFRQAFARYLAKDGKKELAAQETAYAFSLEPTAQNAWAHLNQLWSNKDFADSLTAGKKYLQQFPEDLGMQERYAATLEQLKQYDEAVSVYRQLLEELSETRKTYEKYCIKIAGLYAQQKLYDEAIETFRQGIKKYPRAGILYYHMGLTLRTMKKNEEALAALKKAASFNLDNIWFRYHLGEEYRRNRLEQEALSEWKECLALKSNFAPCRTGIEQIRKQFGLPASGQ
jgi:O-antigen ligase/Flp pilus assembly protein TadD